MFAYALRKSHEPANRVSLERDRGDSRGKEPLDVIADFLRKVTGAVPDDAQLAILRAGYEECR